MIRYPARPFNAVVSKKCVKLLVMALIPYRRHRSGKNNGCVRSYEQNHRILVHDRMTSEEKKADCKCPIVVSGNLPLERGRIKHLSTGTDNVEKALEIVAQWEKWGALTDPSPAPNTNVTVEDAIQRFLEWRGPAGRKLAEGTMNLYETISSTASGPSAALPASPSSKHSRARGPCKTAS